MHSQQLLTHQITADDLKNILANKISLEENPNLYLRLSIFLMQRGKLELAGEMVSQLARIKKLPEDKIIKLLLANYMQSKSKLLELMYQFSDDEDAYIDYGALLLDKDELNEAISHFHFMLNERFKASKAAHLGLAMAYYDKQEIKLAMDHALTALEIDPSFGLAYLYLGHCYMLCNYPQSAMTCYEEAKKFQVSNPFSKEIIYIQATSEEEKWINEFVQFFKQQERRRLQAFIQSGYTNVKDKLSVEKKYQEIVRFRQAHSLAETDEEKQLAKAIANQEYKAAKKIADSLLTRLKFSLSIHASFTPGEGLKSSKLVEIKPDVVEENNSLHLSMETRVAPSEKVKGESSSKIKKSCEKEMNNLKQIISQGLTFFPTKFHDFSNQLKLIQKNHIDHFQYEIALNEVTKLITNIHEFLAGDAEKNADKADLSATQDSEDNLSSPGSPQSPLSPRASQSLFRKKNELPILAIEELSKCRRN